MRARFMLVPPNQPLVSCCDWMSIVTDESLYRKAPGSTRMLSPATSAMIRDGVELGVAMDRLVGAHDTKRGAGAVGILTGGLVDRQRAYESLVAYALAPFMTRELY